jgi:preprotein translocase subunit YajC
MRRKQKKLETLVKQLKTGDKVLLNSGIFGTITGVEEEAFQIRIDDKTRIKVLKSAVAGLQPEPGSPTEK